MESALPLAQEILSGLTTHRRKAAEARKWQQSEGCALEKIKGEIMRMLCSDIAGLEKKKAAALKRDELDARLAKLSDEAKSVGEAPATVDSYADAMAEGLAALGYVIDDKAKGTTARNWAKAIGVEVMAGFGPGAILLMLGRLGRPRAAERERVRDNTKTKMEGRPEAPAKARESAGKALAGEPPLPAAMDDPVHSFIARRLERHEGEIVAAGALWKLWQDDCAQTGVAAGSQQAFGRQMKKWFAHETNNGRPRYLNDRAKTEGVGLKMVVNNLEGR